MSGTAATQFVIGMTHQPVWSSQLIELAAVVTARLHDHPHPGRDEGMPRHPTSGCPPSQSSRTEARLTVPSNPIGDNHHPT